MSIRKKMTVALAAVALVAGGSVLNSSLNPAQAADYVTGYEVFPLTPSRQQHVNIGAGTTTLMTGTIASLDCGKYGGGAYNITVYGMPAAGYLVAWGQGGMPNTSLINYTGAGQVENGMYVGPGWCSGGNTYIQVYTSQPVTIIVDRHARFLWGP